MNGVENAVLSFKCIFSDLRFREKIFVLKNETKGLFFMSKDAFV